MNAMFVINIFLTPYLEIQRFDFSSLSLSVPSLFLYFYSYFLNFFAEERKLQLAIMHSMCKRPSFLQSCSRLDIKYSYEIVLNVILASDITYLLHFSHLTNLTRKDFNMEPKLTVNLNFCFFLSFDFLVRSMWIARVQNIVFTWTWMFRVKCVGNL